MNKVNIPFATAQSIYAINPVFLEKLGITTVLTDLDNTLEPYNQKEPTERNKRLVEELSLHGIKLIIASNSRGKRVNLFASYMGVKAVCFLFKPFTSRLRKLLKDYGLNKDEVVLIGDQIQTDVKAANKLGIKAILTEPINHNEPLWTKFNRMCEKRKREKIVKEKLVKDYKEIIL